MRRRLLGGLFCGSLTAASIASGYYYATHLDTVPHSKRKRFIDKSPEEELQLGIMATQQVLQIYKRAILPPDHPITKAVERVGWNIINHTDLAYEEWQFFVIESPEINAFVVPGGKVFVFTGILPAMKDEHGMATVLAHEIGHVAARHGVEKMSKEWIFASMKWIVLQFTGGATTLDFAQMLGLDLPFSRQCEAEADYIGLLLMARAGYNPERAKELWERFPTGQIPYLSTHPSNQKRIKNITRWLPKVLDENQEWLAAQQQHQPTAQQQQHQWKEDTWHL